MMQAVPSSEPPDHHDGQDGKHAGTTIESSNNQLVFWQGVALLTADCLGVGVLALPNDVSVLGYGLGLSFLILNFPLNFYAGDLLSFMALHLERGITGHHHRGGNDDADFDLSLEEEESVEHDKQVEMTSVVDPERSPTMFHRHSKLSGGGSPSPSGSSNKSYSSAHSYAGLPKVPVLSQPTKEKTIIPAETFQDEPMPHDDDHNDNPSSDPHSTNDDDEHHGSSSTQDLIGMSKSIFIDSPRMTHWVIWIYYLNLFLVLGDYILVMARAVSAIFQDEICIPTAGIVASLLMFAICQFRTMALLGRIVSLASLLAMMIVLIVCLVHHRSNTTTTSDVDDATESTNDDDSILWAEQFSALASIGFAVGSQKLFLNIRHELAHKEEASRVLAGSLTTYGAVYVFVILLAGKHPPSFLFDAIPEGWSRQLAGLLLWAHVAVSYAINSQALCSSMDRFAVQSSHSWATTHPCQRWFVLTLGVAVSSYLVSNAVPFFKDLVALIGALTSVPLTLTLPALLYRQFYKWRLCLPKREWATTRRQRSQGSEAPSSWGSYSLLLYSLAFLAVGLVGALSAIDEDWLSHGRPFSCR